MSLRKYQLDLYPIGSRSDKFEHEHSHLLGDREVWLEEVHIGMQLRFDYGTEEFDFTPDEDGGSPIYVTVTHIEAFMDNETNSRQNGTTIISASVNLDHYTGEWSGTLQGLLDYWHHLDEQAQKKPKGKKRSSKRI